MTDLQNHIAAVMAAPLDKVAALTLTDHFQDANDYPRWTALRKVAAVRRPFLDAHFIERAARVMRCRNFARHASLLRVLAEVGLESFPDTPVFVVRGHRRPAVIGDASALFSGDTSGAVVQVGARELLRLYREEQKRQRLWVTDHVKRFRR